MIFALIIQNLSNVYRQTFSLFAQNDCRNTNTIQTSICKSHTGDVRVLWDFYRKITNILYCLAFTH